jgi:hypothetical protein
VAAAQGSLVDEPGASAPAPGAVATSRRPRPGWPSTSCRRRRCRRRRSGGRGSSRSSWR